MLGAGKQREWLRPLNPEGSLDADGDPDLENIVGCHTGPFVGLNVPNPKPGYEYIWESRKPNEITRAKMRGGVRVQAEDPEAAGLRKLQDRDDARTNDQADSDGWCNMNDVTLFRYDAETIRRIRAEEASRAHALMRGGAAEFADRASAIEQQMSGGQDTRFRLRRHGLTTVDSADRPVEHWSPEDGIIRSTSVPND